MKKFFKQLNRFLYLKDYELFINNKVLEKDHELKYAQDLLVEYSRTNTVGINSPLMAEANIYVNHIKEIRKKEKEDENKLLKHLREAPIKFNKE